MKNTIVLKAKEQERVQQKTLSWYAGRCSEQWCD